MTLQGPTVVSDASHFRRAWPTALLIAGLGLAVVWIALLGYELIGLVGMAL